MASAKLGEYAPALIWLQWGVAAMAIVSLHPYLLWLHQKPAYGIATLLIVAAAAACWRLLDFRQERVDLSIAFCLFLIYLTILPKSEGGYTRWVFLIPFTVAMLHLNRDDLRGAFNKFYWIFAVSLLPGMALWLLTISGMPLELRYTDVPVEIRSRGDIGYVEWPGALFIVSNAIVLPHGGTMFRLCGMYDEPGTVGTISALCLAASRFRLDTRGLIAFTAGLMSFSIAFAVMTAIGLLSMAAYQRRAIYAAAAALSIAMGLVPLLGLKSSAAASNITMRMQGQYAPASAPASGVQQSLVQDSAWSLRNSPLDSRSNPTLRKVLQIYSESVPRKIVFGISSDASTVHGAGGSVWYRVLIDYGIVGFVWLFALFAYPVWSLWRRRELDAGVMVFVLLFLMSFYQRPVIWLPAQLLIYTAGLSYFLLRPDPVLKRV